MLIINVTSINMYLYMYMYIQAIYVYIYIYTIYMCRFINMGLIRSRDELIDRLQRHSQVLEASGAERSAVPRLPFWNLP